VSDGREAQNRPDGLDGLIAETSGFLLAFLRTWALQLFAPHRASRMLLADADTGHDRFVSAPSFVVVGAILVGLGVASPPDLAHIPSWLADVAEQAIKALEFDEDTFYLLASAILQAGLVYTTARVGALLGPRELRTESTRVLAYVLTATQLGFLVGMAAVAATHNTLGIDETLVTYAVLGWVLVAAPVTALTSWVAATHSGTMRLLRLAGAPVLLALGYLAMDASQTWLYDRFEQLEVAKVSLDARVKPDEQGAWYSLALDGWLDAGEVYELCQPALCPADPAKRQGNPDPCVEAQFSRGWVPPEWETRLELYVTRRAGLVGQAAVGVAEPTAGMLLCCNDSRAACFSGFSWDMWTHAEDMRSQTAILGRDLTEREARGIVRSELQLLRDGIALYVDAQGALPELAAHPRPQTELNADMRGFSSDDPSWQRVQQLAEMGPTRGAFWSKAGADGLVIMAATDLDGDGSPALFMVTLDGPVQRLTADSVY